MISCYFLIGSLCALVKLCILLGNNTNILYSYYYAEITVVWGTTGVFVFVVSTLRLLVAGVKLLVSLRSVKLCYMFALRNRYLLGKQILNYVGHFSIEHKFLLVKCCDAFNFFICFTWCSLVFDTDQKNSDIFQQI